jgi:hypothetical protein
MVAKIEGSDPWSLKYQEQPELMRELNSRPARITINGKRHYHTPFVTGPAPSVTTILSETASEANKRKLEMWSKGKPWCQELAAERGTAIHYGMECYLKGNKTLRLLRSMQSSGPGCPQFLTNLKKCYGLRHLC